MACLEMYPQEAETLANQASTNIKNLFLPTSINGNAHVLLKEELIHQELPIALENQVVVYANKDFDKLHIWN